MKKSLIGIVGFGAIALSAFQAEASSKLAITGEMGLPEKAKEELVKAYDGDIATFVGSAHCRHFGIGVKFNAAQKLAAVRFYPREGQVKFTRYANIEGSSDGKAWTRLVRFRVYGDMPDNSWIYTTLPYVAEYQYYRISDIGEANVAEVEWYACDNGFKKGDYRPIPIQYQDSLEVDFTKTPITIMTPEYRGMVSTARRESAVKFRYMLNTALGAVDGITVNTVIKNEEGETVDACSNSGCGIWGWFKNLFSFGGATFSFKTEFGTPTYVDIPFAADAPAGKYTLCASYEIDGKEYETVVPFKVVPVRPKQFFVDQDGVILKEGKPFFPLGMHHAHGFQIEEWIDMGVNMIQMWSWDWMHNYSTNSAYWYIQPTNEAHRAKQMASNLKNIRLLEEKDIYVIYEDGAVWNELILQLMGRFGTKADKWREGIYTFENNVNFRASIEAIIKDPLSRLGMWYLADEAGGDSWVPKLQRAGKYFHDLDEDHPTFNLSAGDHSIAAGGDVYSFDCYPRYYGGTGVLTRISNTTYDAYKQVGKTKAIIVVPQAFGQSEKQPSEHPDHVRAMSYMSIARGARGMFWYCWKQTGDWSGVNKQGMGWNPPTAKMVKTLIAEFKVFKQALLEPNPEFLTSDDGLVLGIIAGSERTGRYLIYVNGDLTKTSDSAMKVSLKDGTELEPLFNGPAGEIKNGKLALKLPALATGVFRIK